MKKLYLLWCDVKRFFARYHPQTKERMVNGTREWWDDNYRGWRKAQEETADAALDRRMQLAKDSENWVEYARLGGAKDFIERTAKDGPHSLIPTALHRPKDERMSLFPDGYKPKVGE